MKVKDSIEIKKEERIKWPKVAIIILNWNGWKDTIECLESVFRNTYPNYQVIIVDNGSTDGSMGKIKKWAEGKQEILTPKPNHPLYHLSHPPVKKPIPYIYYTREEAEKGGNFQKEDELTKKWIIENKKTYLSDNPTTNYPLILIQTGDNLGFAGGNNVGIKFSSKNRAQYILLLNNDTVVKSNFLEKLIKVVIQGDKIAIIGSVIIDYYTRKIVFTNSTIDRKLRATIMKDYLYSSKEYWKTERTSGASMMLNTAFILKYSLFLDEKLFLYCEEIDLCLRANKLGLKILIAGFSYIYHKEGRSCSGNTKCITTYYILRNRILLAKKLLSLKDQIIFWIFFIPARIFRVLEWLIEGKWDLIKVTYLALKDGKNGNVGKSKEI